MLIISSDKSRSLKEII